MDKKEFEEWYRENIETMAKLGVLHPDSPFGKTVHLAIASLQPQINTINERLENIEKLLQTDYVPSETKAKPKKKLPAKKFTLKAVEEKKIEQVKVEQPKNEQVQTIPGRSRPPRQVTQGEWQVPKK